MKNKLTHNQMAKDQDPNDPLKVLLQQLPPLPSIIRYYDDFEDKIRTINNFPICKSVQFYTSGSKINIYFDLYDEDIELLAKHLCVYFIFEDLQASTIYNRLQTLYDVSREDIIQIIVAGKNGIKPLWSQLLTKKNWYRHTLITLKSFLFFLAKHNLCGWSPSYSEFISKTLPLPDVDKYASVRAGDVFLITEEESCIVRFLDGFVLSINQDQTTVEYDDLRYAGMLLCSYQFGMRPLQIASLTLRDVRLWNQTEGHSDISVHLTFKTVKQRSKTSGHALLRRVKHEWASIIIELYNRSTNNNSEGNDRLFAVKSAQEVSGAISKLASELTGRNTNATDLRHTAAQRLVDAGASQEELAEFMGHADITTGLVYFQTSPNQAERVNRALGISSVYQRIAKIAHDRFISEEELAGLKGEQQIAGVPHGIPIAGIGGCSSGQPACPYNPITSCYGCRKFMPLHDTKIHQQVLQDLRNVVRFFDEASKGDVHSPAYMQLQQTISGIQQIIAEIEGTKYA